MPACIAGMHRSGTSMVARALAACGLELGSESELIGPTADNEWGHWEPTFGLIAVDRKTQARSPRPSAYWLGKVARTRAL